MSKIGLWQEQSIQTILKPWLTLLQQLPDSMGMGAVHYLYFNKMVREPNVSPHKQIIKDDDVKECISTE